MEDKIYQPQPDNPPKYNDRAGLSLPYYMAYERRYRRVYSQGVDFWTAHPDEIGQTIELFDVFLHADKMADPKILECGCGEGYLAEYIAGRGLQYTGVDISSSAIEKARNRIEQSGALVQPAFHVADSLNLNFLPNASFNMLVDNCHFQMLGTDSDRRRYLAGVWRLLASGGRAFFRQNLLTGRPINNVKSYEDYLKKSGVDLVTEEDRQAWQAGKTVRIRLPRVPVRMSNREGYISELEMAGFRIQMFKSLGTMCVFHAQKTEYIM